jgi:hypothetical protein
VKYLVLLYQDEQVWASAEAAEQARYFEAHAAFDAAVTESGKMLGGEALVSVANATTLRHWDGQAIITDGPFAETAEQLGGFYLVDAPDLDVMLRISGLLPTAYTVEIRPVADMNELMA